MISKVSRSFIFLYAFTSCFLILLLTLFAYFHATGKQEWFLELVRVQLWQLPLLVYMILFSVVVGVLAVVNVHMAYRMQYSVIENKIRLLVSGHYESKLLDKPIAFSNNSGASHYVSEVDAGILQIRSKMVEMSKELQLLTSSPRLVAGETKEEILQQERSRLARELHDSVSQQLFAAMMMLAALNEQAEKTETLEKFRKPLNMVGDMINASQSEMRALLLHLRPISLEGKSLRKGIEQLLVELQTKIQIGLVWEVEDVQLHNSMEDHLFRIVQELLSNTLRHSKAKELEVYLKQVDQTVRLRMVDDGIGFDVKEERLGSYGLGNIRERVAGMGGTCKIISFKGKGTSVEIQVPVIRGEKAND